MVDLNRIVLPEFRRSRTYRHIEGRILHADCRYDIIFGRDALHLFGYKPDFKTHLMKIGDDIVPMRPLPAPPPSPEPTIAEALLLDSIDYELFDNDESYPDFEETEHSYDPSETDTRDESFAAPIHANSYDAMDITRIINACDYLDSSKRNDLISCLSNYPTLFDGVLRSYPGVKVHLNVDPNATPRATRAYSVPQTQLELFKKELDRLVAAGVLEPGTRSEWISGTFIIPKKDGKARWISDFRALNSAIRRKVYPLPRIQDIMQKRRSYKFVTKIDLSMCFYTYELDDESKDKCTIATPFGLYRYRRLPQGINQGPDVAQELIEGVLRGLDDVVAYIDDIAIFSDDWETHLATVNEVLSRLNAHGYAVNPEKCEWAVKETDFLGHYLTPNGIKPWKKKVRAIIDMKRPTNLKQLRAFIGLVNYYRDMWPKRSHTLAPLTELTGARHFTWTDRHTAAFNRMKAIVAADVLLTYPDHNCPFEIETDASDYQLGAVIKQRGRPVAYYSRKLNSAQQNYTTIEKELLSVVETLREFRSMLLGAKINVHTDHKNLSHKLTRYTTQRVLRWRLLLEEFNPTFHYRPGPDNQVADGLSRVPTSRASRSKALNDLLVSDTTCSDFSNIFDDDELADCLWSHPGFDIDGFLEAPVFDSNAPLWNPFHFDTIRRYQLNDDGLHKRISENLNDYVPRSLSNTEVMTYQKGVQQMIKNGTLSPGSLTPMYGNGPRSPGASTPGASAPESLTQWQIAIPDNMLEKLVKWYHETTAHSEGVERLFATMSRHFHHPRLKVTIRKILEPCLICQQMKTGQRSYGLLAPRDALLNPWHDVHVDSIGPWKIETSKVSMTFSALTCLEPVFNLLEIFPQRNKTAQESADLFENHWLSRYPRPRRVIHDNGPEFKGDFQDMLLRFGIRATPISPRTPTSNGLIENTHKAIGQIIRTLVAAKPPSNQQEADRLVQHAYATALHASRCASNQNLGGFSPGALAFRRDMHLDIPLIADVHVLRELRQAKIDERLIRSNASRIPVDYQIGDKVMFRNLFEAKDKARPVYLGPFPITRVHTNNTVTIARNPDVEERVSIRRLKPFRS